VGKNFISGLKVTMDNNLEFSQEMSKIINVSENVVETRLESFKSKSRNNTQRKEEILMKSLVDFYSYSVNLDQLLPILLKKSKISLRVLDWFVTNYSKEYNVCYNIVYPSTLQRRRNRRFIIYDSYKAQLKAFHKKMFDPFCRRHRIYFEYCEGCEVQTTVGQLNFFKWAIQNKVLDYVEKNLKKITEHMALKNKEEEPEPVVGITMEAEIEMDEDNNLIAKIGFK